jgi:CRP/FNR family cyclic AMP-dependent transcriptional regulator
MAATREYEVLRKSVLAKELSDAQCEVLAGLISLQRLADNEVVCGEGQSDSTLHAVVSGALGVSKRDDKGSWENLHVITAGDLAGELSFIDETPHYAALRALGETEILNLERSRFEALLDTHPQIVYRVMRAIMRTVHGILRRISVEEKELANYIFKQHGKY